MSFRYCESFDDVANWASFGDERGWEQIIEGTGVDGVFDATGGRRGGGAFKVNNVQSSNNSFPRRQFIWAPNGAGLDVSSVLIGFAIKFSAALSTGSSYPLMTLVNSAGQNVCSVELAYSAPNWTLQYTASTVRYTFTLSSTPSANDWHYFECSVNGFATTASQVVKLGWNGVYGTSGNIITANSSATPNNAIRKISLLCLNAATLSFGYAVGGSGNVWIDDLYLGTPGAGNTNMTDLIGDCRVDLIRPTSDGNSAQFTKSSGANGYALLSETDQDGDTTNINSSTVGHKSDFGFADLSHSPSAVYGAASHVVARRDAAGARTLRQYKRYSTTDTEAASTYDLTLTTSYQPQVISWENYDAGLARVMTPAEFNNIGWGVKVQS